MRRRRKPFTYEDARRQVIRDIARTVARRLPGGELEFLKSFPDAKTHSRPTTNEVLGRPDLAAGDSGKEEG